jgi:hypothetical protein
VRQIFVVLALVSASFTARAHDVISTKVTWTREISRIIFDHCVSCHHENGSAFSLTTYQAARPWAKAIKEETLERRMPPFGAAKGFSDLKDDQSLMQEQLELISDWVEGGAPEGDPSLLPKNSALAAAEPDAPENGAELVIVGDTILRQQTTLTAVRPKTLREGSTVQVVAVRPDGGVTPIIWIYNFNPKFTQTYYFRKPVTFPAGTRIVTSAADVGAITLFGSAGSGAGEKSVSLHPNATAKH